MMGRGRGQALIEFAVVVGAVVVLSVGAIQSLYAFYLTRQVRAAAEEIADLAAVHGGVVEEGPVREILLQHRLDADLAAWEIVPATASYLDPLVVTLQYDVIVRFYGLFDLAVPAQHVRRLCEGG